MALFTAQQQIFEQSSPSQDSYDTVTIGTVVDTNDPQQMGRVRVVCAQWGDSWSDIVEDLPWAIYVSPFGGQMQVGTRGPGIQQSEGGLAYGMWAIPKVGAQVMVLCIDGNPSARAYFGCIYDQFTPHTMPHGRFMYDDHPGLEKADGAPTPFGPYTSSEKYVQPLAANMSRAFGMNGDPNFEYRTRAADYTVARVDVSQLSQTYSNVQDDANIEHEGWTSTQGYQSSRSDPDSPSTLTDKNYDSQVYSFTSPGFHALSMDDRQENCRVRLRTTSGHQIILDDTNERIYIATAQGNNWIELDQEGNIDIYTANKLSVHATKEINFTSDDTIRMYAKKGIHMHSDDEVRIEAKKDIHIKTAQSIRTKADSDIYTEAAKTIQSKSGSELKLTSGGGTHFNSGANLIATAPEIHLNGPAASKAQSPEEQQAFWTDRVPQHEPWARTMTKDDLTHEPEVPYDSKDVGIIERGRRIIRGLFWRR